MDVAECDNVGIITGDADCEDKTTQRSPFKNLNGAINYLTSKVRLAFTKLRKTFTKAPILQHFDLKCYIIIETDASSYAIDEVWSQLTSNILNQWHLVVFYLQKMISAKTQYKTHNGKFLTIVVAFKTWWHYLKSCKHKIPMFTNHNNLRCFINTKSLSSKQNCWTQKLSKYYFWIDYCQDKAYRAADALFSFLRRDKNKEEKL